MSYGDMICEARKAKGLTQEDLAQRLGVSRQSIIYWEQEAVKPSDAARMAICSALDMAVEPFLLAVTSSDTEPKKEAP